MNNRSSPTFTEFDPTSIPFQAKVINAIDFNLDFSIGTHEILLSGSIGSAKTTLAAHLAIKHCLKYPNARVGIGRKSLGDIKATIFRAICEQIEDDPALSMVDKILQNTAQIYFKNGSSIEAISWSDKKFMRFRSRIYSFFIFEEAIENDGEYSQAFVECRQRVGRVTHIPESVILYCTNPGSPGSHLYNYFFIENQPTRHVFKSLTEQNPFLPKTYIEQLKRDLPPKEVERQLLGNWIDIDRERVYYSYKSEFNFKKQDYIVQPHSPIRICYDFNIGYGKPMSVALGQYILAKDEWHFFDEVVIEGTRTEDTLEEMASRGIFEMPHEFIIHGDATGAARSAASKYSNYEVIKQFLDNYKTKSGLKLNYRVLVPRSNPPIRERHIIVNGYCENSLGHRRLFVYQKAKTVDEGLRLTALKKGADYLEDDSKSYQHITTALGYGVVYVSKNKVILKGGNIG